MSPFRFNRHDTRTAWGTADQQGSKRKDFLKRTQTAKIPFAINGQLLVLR